MVECVAALDCGSNSTRLLVVSRDAVVSQRETRITRLSAGVDATRTLTPEAMSRSYGVLSEYRTIMDEHGVASGLLVATSAVRDARNGEEFLAEARRRTRVDVRVLDGTEEARYSYEGATADLEPDRRPTAILDIGGGSTELAVDVGGELHSYSMQLGCVRVTERALGREIVTPEAAGAAQAMIEAELDRAWTAEPLFASLSGDLRLIGLAGTVATLAQLDAGERTYRRASVHHRRISRSQVQQWRDLLGAEPPAERLARPGMAAGREDVLVAGLYVLDAVMARLGVEELLSSESDILDGVAVSLWDSRRA